MSKKEKNLVVLLINSLGVSFGWKGNAVLSADPKAFSEIWSNSRRVFISPTNHFEEAPGEPVNRDMQYYRFGSGEDFPTGQEQLDHFVEHEISKNIKIAEMIDYVKRHNSQLRLMIVLTPSDIRAHTKLIEKLLLLAKTNNFFNLNIDFILGEGFKSTAELSQHLTRIESIIAHSHIGSITSFSGAGFVQDRTTNKKKLNQFCENFENCLGRRYVSVSQFIERNKSKDPFIVEPSIILPDGRRQATLSSFSAILFSSSSNSPYCSLLSIISKPVFHHFKHMKAALTQNAENIENLNCVVAASSQKSLNRKLRDQNYQTAIVSEDIRASQLRQGLFYDGKPNASFLIATPDKSDAYLSNVSRVNQEIFRKSLSLIKEKKYNLLLIDLPCLERGANAGSFKKTVDIFKNIDSFLLPLKDAILESDSSLILSSLYGGVEKMMVKKIHGTEETYCETTKSPLPLIYIESDAVKNKSLKMHEVAQISGQVTSLSATILDYFEILPNASAEESLLSRLATGEK